MVVWLATTEHPLGVRDLFVVAKRGTFPIQRQHHQQHQDVQFPQLQPPVQRNGLLMYLFNKPHECLVSPCLPKITTQGKFQWRSSSD